MMSIKSLTQNDYLFTQDLRRQVDKYELHRSCSVFVYGM